MFNFQDITTWIHGMLTGTLGLPEWAAILTESIGVALAVITLYAVFAIFLIYMERKVCAAFQCRLGPNRVGPWGTIQLICDMVKMLTKEIISVRKSDKFLYNLAPFIVILASVMAFSCLPFGNGLEVLDFNVGIFFLMAS